MARKIGLGVLTEEELRRVQHFVENGQRDDGLMATDEWVEEMMGKLAAELEDIRRRAVIFEETAQSFADVRMCARKVYLAWRKSRPLGPPMEALGAALKGK